MSSPSSAVPSTLPTAASVPSPATAPEASTPAVSAPVGPAPAVSARVGSARGVPAGPTVAELLDFVRRTAEDTALIASLPLDPEGRTWVRLDGPRGSEAWLIGWPPGTGTGWHDHADSVGAFTTASGTLKEHSLAVRLPTDGWKTLELTDGVDRERELAAGQGRAFGQNHVHEVLNESDSVHAVSVHAYYPPLPRIRRFSRTGAVLRLEQTEVPEDWQ
ncbi:cysteine dioxygenase [Streptomyces bacillaris]|uniref:Cysteine dioxygenase n=1 Tax=Streptomyces cavourensis TaxID=67258 RepID=A0AAD0Q8S6_9ACTN|nr:MULTISPECIES: cysteine dioxygenase [Streptomyces]AXI74415.1 cysteine dioxygenase [Streptomyces cavourensis]MBH0243026.1 cysteine dioxygenase [Streptomyces cavourensis]NUV43821.1 cysteine dioxygenase [Streptomyces sp. CAI-24]NUV82644.1 cysteine dioxygenase [Streptomyces sp. CAI-155]TQO33362.1 cysteine dioxygenase type I [Streptomyces cavourensis]